jgi:hypothetical protein
MMFRVKFSYGIVLTPMLSGCFNPKDAVDRNPPTFSPKADISKFVQGGWIRIQETANATMPLPASIAFTSHERITVSFNRRKLYLRLYGLRSPQSGLAAYEEDMA